MAEKLDEQKIKVVPKPEPQIGIDLDHTLENEIIEAGQLGLLDVSGIDALSNTAQNRERIYELLDSMLQDGKISAVLDTYAEDTVQTNDQGKAVWVESNNADILSYTSYLMDSLNIDKQLYQWAHCLYSYGDVYARLYRRSDYGKDFLFKDNKRTKKLNESKDNEILRKNNINEDVNLKIYSDSDPYIPYVEMIPNPAEMFDLQKFGKTHGFIQAPVRNIQTADDELTTYSTRYKMKETDVSVYDAMSFVHGSLTGANNRNPETVDIYLTKDGKDFNLNDDDIDKNENVISSSYSVKRGQSLLYDAYRDWRELNLLEMSALLNRLTKSSVVRCVTVETGDMAKEQARNFVDRLKQMIENKSAINAGTNMAEYTNPGPVVNTIYTTTHDGKGAISLQNIGGDFDPKSLVDIEYFRDKVYGDLKVPKQFFGWTEDGAGFNGGTSLTILSSRYGKTIKLGQSILCQMIKDIINLFLIDRGLDNYVNKFDVKMQPPVTQEEIDRRTNGENALRRVSDIMTSIGDQIEDKALKLKIMKTLLSPVINDEEVMAYFQTYIDTVEAQEEAKAEEKSDDKGSNNSEESPEESEELPSLDFESPVEEDVKISEDKETLTEDESAEDDSYLPNPAELGLDMTDDLEEK